MDGVPDIQKRWREVCYNSNNTQDPRCCVNLVICKIWEAGCTCLQCEPWIVGGSEIGLLYIFEPELACLEMLRPFWSLTNQQN